MNKTSWKLEKTKNVSEVLLIGKNVEKPHWGLCAQHTQYSNPWMHTAWIYPWMLWILTVCYSCKYGGQRWRWGRWGNEGWDGWNFINRVCSIQSIIFDPLGNKMLATWLDCLIGAELSELSLTEQTSCLVRLGSLPSLPGPMIVYEFPGLVLL